MAITITDRRTVIDEAESVTNWTGAGFGVVSTDVAEAINAVAASSNSTNQAVYFTYPVTGGIDLSDELVYVYSFNNALQDSWSADPPPNSLLIGDGTNRIAFHMAGADRRVFNHLEGPTNWQSLVLDGSQADVMDAAGNSYVDAGSFGALDLTAIENIGTRTDCNSKALGGGYNIAVDIMRYGNDGIYVAGGTSGDKGSFSELAAADRSTANKAGHGIFREYAPVSFGCQGPLTFGVPPSATDSYFYDDGAVVVFEDRNIGDDKYYFDIGGNSGATNSFELINSTITTAAQNVSVAAGNDIDILDLDTVSFVNLVNDMYFPTDSASQTHSIDNCIFTGCGTIDPGTAPFRDCSFSSVSSSASSGALLYNDNINVENCNFANNTVPGSGGYAITHTISGGYVYTGLTFSGNDYDILYLGPSGSVLTIQATQGSNPSTWYAPYEGIVDIQNSKTLTLSGLVSGSEVRIYDTGTITERGGVEDSSTSFDFVYNYSASDYVDIVIHHVDYVYFRIDNYLLSDSDTAIPISQQFDRWYSNP